MSTSVNEAFSPTSLVLWHGKIEKHISDLIDRYANQHNVEYVNKLREFLRLWRSYPISGSVNIEELTPLEAAASTLAVDSWKLSNYFTALRDRIRAVIASQQELPAIDAGYTAGNRRSQPRPPSTFGASKTAGPEDAGEVTAAPPADNKAARSLAPEKFSSEESLRVVAARILSSTRGFTIQEIRERKDLQLAEKLGWIAYVPVADRYYIRSYEDVNQAANSSYDIGDEVVTTYNGKPVKGVVQRSMQDGSYEIGFDGSNNDQPRQPISVRKDQLRKNVQDNPSAPGSPKTVAARQYYGISGSANKNPPI